LKAEWCIHKVLIDIDRYDVLYRRANLNRSN
jgi:hypothetical protein